jgi:hypothetical protein
MYDGTIIYTFLFGGELEHLLYNFLSYESELLFNS